MTQNKTKKFDFGISRFTNKKELPIAEDDKIWSLVADVSAGKVVDEYNVEGMHVVISLHKDGLHYQVTEPKLAPEIHDAFVKTKNHMLSAGSLDEKDGGEDDVVEFEDLTKKELLEKFETAAKSLFTYEMLMRHRNAVQYYLVRDVLGFGIIDMLEKDDKIEDMTVSQLGVPVAILHRDHTPGELIPTNIVFDHKYEQKTSKKILDGHNVLGNLILKLAEKFDKHPTSFEPYKEGRLPTGDRIATIVKSDISPDSGSITIRKPAKTVMTLPMLLHQNVLPYELAALVWRIFDTPGGTGIVYGSPFSGKTTTANALTNMVNQFWKIITVEDTEELRLLQKNKLKLITKKADEEHTVGYMKLFEYAMRKSPRFVCVGEVRTSEAIGMLHLFESGVSAVATFHATNESSTIQRLRSLGVAEAQLLDVWFLMGMGLAHGDGKSKRRVLKFSETHEKDGHVVFKPIVHYDKIGKSFVGADLENLIKSKRSQEAVEAQGIVDSYDDLKKRTDFLRSLVGRKLFSENEVRDAFTQYHVQKLFSQYGA